MLDLLDLPDFSWRFHKTPIQKEKEVLDRIRENLVPEPDEISVFSCPPNAGCDHVWDGPIVEWDNVSSASCSKCGMLSINWWMWYGP